MNSLGTILILFVALLQTSFLVLEMFFWTKPLGLKIFGQTLSQATSSATLAANQGLYNGFLAAGLIWGLAHPSAEIGFQLKVFFLGCIMLAGLYGGYSVDKKIVLVQFLPALVALTSVWFWRS